MLRTPSILGPLNSGFVPFSPAAPVDALADDAIAAEAAIAETAEVVARAAATPLSEAPLAEPVAPWAPSSSASIRLVEGAVIAAICGYFAWGVLRTLAGGCLRSRPIALLRCRPAGDRQTGERVRR